MPKDKILDISVILKHINPKKVRSLDIDGVPNAIKQMSVVDTNK